MLPTEVYANPVCIDKEWDTMNEFEREDALSDFLSDEYGFCHNGFSYEEINGKIHITNIEWDEEE